MAYDTVTHIPQWSIKDEYSYLNAYKDIHDDTVVSRICEKQDFF